MDSGKSAAGKQSKPSHFDAAARGATANRRFITPEPGMSQQGLSLRGLLRGRPAQSASGFL
jgi:hypothetical protein